MSLKQIDPLKDSAGRTLARVGEDGLLYLPTKMLDHCDADALRKWLDLAIVPAMTPDNPVSTESCLPILQEFLELGGFFNPELMERAKSQNLFIRCRDELQSARLALQPVRDGTRKCMADMHADPPRDCDAPFCGCNPEWTRTIEQLQECGWQRVPPTHVMVPRVLTYEMKYAMEEASGLMLRDQPPWQVVWDHALAASKGTPDAGQESDLLDVSQSSDIPDAEGAS